MEDYLCELVDNAITDNGIDHLLNFLRQRDEMYEDVAYVIKEMESRLQACLINMSENEKVLSDILELIDRFSSNINFDGELNTLLASQLLLVISNKNCSFDNFKNAALCLNKLLDDNACLKCRQLLEEEIIKKPVEELGRKVAEIGDYQCQSLLFEVMCRLLMYADNKPEWASTWFNSEEMQSCFLNVKPEQFESDCRKSLNFLNRNEPITRIFSFVATSVCFGNYQLKEPEESGFWIDCNYSSEKISFFYADISEDEDNEHTWVTAYIPIKIIQNYTITDNLMTKDLTLYLNVSCSELIRLPSSTPSEYVNNEVKITFCSLHEIDELLSYLMKFIDPEMNMDNAESDITDKNNEKDPEMNIDNADSDIQDKNSEKTKFREDSSKKVKKFSENTELFGTDDIESIDSPKKTKVREDSSKKEKKFSENTELLRTDDIENNDCLKKTKVREDSSKKEKKFSENAELLRTGDIESNDCPRKRRKVSIVNQTIETSEIETISFCGNTRKLSEVNNLLEVNELKPKKIICRKRRSSELNPIRYIDDIEAEYYSKKDKSACKNLIEIDVSDIYSKSLNATKVSEKGIYDETEYEAQLKHQNNSKDIGNLELPNGEVETTAKIDQFCENIMESEKEDHHNMTDFDEENKSSTSNKTVSDISHENVLQEKNKTTKQKQRNQRTKKEKTRKAAMKARETNKMILEQKESEIGSEYSVKNIRTKKTKSSELNAVDHFDKEEAQETESILALLLNDEKSKTNTESEKSALYLIDHNNNKEEQELETNFNDKFDKMEIGENKTNKDRSMDDSISMEDEQEVTKADIVDCPTINCTPSRKRYKKSSHAFDSEAGGSDPSWYKRAKSGLFVTPPLRSYSKKSSSKQKQKKNAIKKSCLKKRKSAKKLSKPNSIDSENRPRSLRLSEIDKYSLVIETRKETVKPLPKGLTVFQFDPISNQEVRPKENSRNSKEDISDNYCSSIKSSKSNKFSSGKSLSKNKENSTTITPIQESLQENNSFPNSLNEFEIENCETVKRSTVPLKQFPMSKETLAETWPRALSNSSRNLSNSSHHAYNTGSKKENKVGVILSPENLNSLPGEEIGKHFHLKKYLESISSCSSPPPEINWLQEKEKSASFKRSLDNTTSLNPIPKKKKLNSYSNQEIQSLKSTVKCISPPKKLKRSKKVINEEIFCIKTISSNDNWSQLNEEMPFSHSVFKTFASEIQNLTQRLFGTLQTYTYNFSAKMSIIRKKLVHIIENMASSDETNKEKDLRVLLQNCKENRYKLQKNLKQLFNFGVKYFEAEKKHEKLLKSIHKKMLSKYVTCAQIAEEEAMKSIEVKLIAIAKSLFKAFLKKINFI